MEEKSIQSEKYPYLDKYTNSIVNYKNFIIFWITKLYLEFLNKKSQFQHFKTSETKKFINLTLRVFKIPIHLLMGIEGPVRHSSESWNLRLYKQSIFSPLT